MYRKSVTMVMVTKGVVAMVMAKNHYVRFLWVQEPIHGSLLNKLSQNFQKPQHFDHGTHEVNSLPRNEITYCLEYTCRDHSLRSLLLFTFETKTSQDTTTLEIPTEYTNMPLLGSCYQTWPTSSTSGLTNSRDLEMKTAILYENKTKLVQQIIHRGRLSVTNLCSENNFPMFQLNAPVVIRVKSERSANKRCYLQPDNLLFIYAAAK